MGRADESGSPPYIFISMTTCASGAMYDGVMVLAAAVTNANDARAMFTEMVLPLLTGSHPVAPFTLSA